MVLRLSSKTLANWRSCGRGPAWRRHGGRVVYARQSVLEWSTENEGQASEGKPERVTVTTRPYFKDQSRTQVDIMISHPGTAAIVRRRLVAPAGYDAERAKAWGEGKVKEILKELFNAQAKPSVESPQERIETPKSQIEAPKRNVPTLGELWSRWEPRMPTKKETYRRTTRRHWNAIQPIVAEVPCDAWTHAIADRVEDRFRDLCAGYQNHCFGLVRTLLQLAVKDGHLREVPTLPWRREEEQLPEVAHGQDEIAMLLSAARACGAENGEPLELMLLLGLDGGLRPAEVAGLRWKDVDWRASQLLIRNQRPLQGDSDCIPKTGESGRITLTRRLRAALEARRGSNASPYVIINKDGDPLYTSRVSWRVERIHRVAGLDAQGGHFLRHCSASRVFQASGGSVSAAQAHLRHKRASTTERYLHAVRGTSAGRQAAALLDSLEDLETGNGTGNGTGNA